MKNNKPVKISVCIFAYNLEKYIAKAIESVLMQKTNFKYELVIGEDCSTDNTREICISYSKQYPETIRLLLRSKNLGMSKNVFNTLKECKGEYVAILDADDYWIDPLKLQKQIDFLDSNPQFSLCCHNSIVIFEDHDFPPYLFNPRNQKQIITVEDIIMKWLMATASMVYRNSCMSFPDWVYKAHNFDVAIQVLVADKGKVRYLNEIMSVYRRTLDSNSFNPNYPLDFVFNKHVELLKLIDEHFKYKYHNVIHEKITILKKRIRKFHLNRKFPFLFHFLYPQNLVRRILKKILKLL